MYIRTSVFVSFETSTTRPVSTQGLLTLSNIQHGVRIEAVFASLQQGEHTDRIQQFPAYIQTRTIILRTELFPKKRREKIQGEILQSSSTVFYKNYNKISSVSTCNPVILCKGNYSTYRINSSTRILQEILQLQGSSHADRY